MSKQFWATDIADAISGDATPVRTLEETRENDIRAMKFIQKISKTKSSDWVTSMEDWEDRSTVEEELLALMLHFKVVNRDRSDGYMWQPQEPNLPNGIIVFKDFRGNPFPYINDPNYFMIRAKKGRNNYFQKSRGNECNGLAENGKVIHRTVPRQQYKWMEQHNVMRSSWNSHGNGRGRTRGQNMRNFHTKIKREPERSHYYHRQRDWNDLRWPRRHQP